MSYFELGNYITIQGRLRRKDWWMMRLILAIIPLLLGIITILLGLAGLHTLSVLIIAVGSIVDVIIGVMLDIRRFHDRDKSGWWLLILFIPLIGAFWLLVEIGFLRGTIGTNRYGPDPVTTGP